MCQSQTKYVCMVICVYVCVLRVCRKEGVYGEGGCHLLDYQ